MRFPRHLFSFSAKLVGLALLSGLGLGALAVIASVKIESVLLQSRIELTMTQAESARSIVANLAAQAERGEMDLTTAQEQAKRIIRGMHYGNDEYFFVYDTHARNIVHGSKSEREGKDFWDVPDVKGHYYWRDLVAVAEAGGGHTFYWFPKYGSAVPVRKVSSVVLFKPWNWVIGTGIYLDDVEATYWQSMRGFLAIAAIALFVVSVMAALLARSLAVPMLKLADVTRRITNGNHVVEVPGTSRRDEIGTLAKALMSLRRSYEDIDSFARISAHDLQEPLRLIASYLQLLKKRYEGQLDKDADEYIAYAVRGAHHLQEMICGVLSYSSVTIENDPMTQTDLNETLREAEIAINSKIEASGAVITAEKLPCIITRKHLVSDIFRMLIDNAVKFSRPGIPPEIHISATHDRHDHCWEFSIADNGIGIDPEYFQRIFTIFHRMHANGTYEGVGVGLATVKKILDQLGGKIWVESTPGAGSVFHFTLPLEHR